MALQALAANQRVDINRVTAEQLQVLPGVGSALAKRIVDHRQTSGPWHKLEQLTEIKGIGEKRIKRWAPYVCFDSEPPR